jgi:GDP-L-fucose synthase
MPKTILVTGGTGFIGRNLIEHFAGRPGYAVIGVHNKRPPFAHEGVTWRQADLRDPRQAEAVLDGVDVLLHAAATTSGSKDIVTRPQIHVTDNAVMGSYLFRAAYERKLGHVLFFSCTVMLPTSSRPLAEGDFDPGQPLHPRYFGVGWTKVYLEKMCEFYGGLGETRFTAVRHSNIYGPHDKYDLERSHVFGATITKVLSATEGRISVWGRGSEGRDLLYVTDLNDFVERALERQPERFGLYHCGLGRATTVKDLVATIVARSGRQLSIEHDLTKPSIDTSLFLDCAKAKRELGWEPRTSLEEGIDRTIAWWRANVGR